MELVAFVRSFVLTVLIYDAEGWTLTKTDEKRIESAELWICHRMLRVSWTEHRTYQIILTELNTTGQLGPKTTRICRAPQALVWPHSQRRGEMCDTEGSE